MGGVWVFSGTTQCNIRILPYFFPRGDTLPKLSEDDQFSGELVGAWTTMFGRLDQASKCYISPFSVHF